MTDGHPEISYRCPKCGNRDTYFEGRTPDCSAGCGFPMVPESPGEIVRSILGIAYELPWMPRIGTLRLLSQELRNELQKRNRPLYVVTAGEGPDETFVEVEDGDGESVSVAWDEHPADSGLHRRGPFYRFPSDPETETISHLDSDLFGCSACGETHEVTFQPLRHPFPDGDDFWTHVGLCENEGEPIFVRVPEGPVSEGEAEDQGADS